MMILVHKTTLEELLKNLRQKFYQPRGLDFEVHVCLPTAGAGMVRL